MNPSFVKKRQIIHIFKDNIIAFLLVILVLFVGFTRDNFFTWANFANIVSNVTPRFIIALGVSGCLIIRGTDLSAGRAVGLAGVIACTLLQRNDYADKFFGGDFVAPETWWYVLGIALFVVFLSMCFGLADGIIISQLKVPPFLATLGMQTVIYGIACIYSDAKPIGGLRQDYTAIATSQMFKIGTFSFKWLFLFALIGGLVFWFLYNMTRYGKYMYAIGGNENAAEVSGVNVKKSIIKIYALAGCMYGLAGFILAAKSAGASVNLGQGYELEAIAACTIGGVSTGGGVGKVSGILLGVLVFELLKSSMQFLGINPYVQQVVQGIVIIVAVAFDVRKYLKRT
ncbi:MAG: beta-methylgalactoside transporter [Lachnospiraceae bacterium]|nr:beta-methylgalactoside transporter [Lachnospiraceae bacterium]